MAKTLIIKGADFTANALDVVNFDVVPCTGITLNKASSKIASIGGTDTLITTVTPANTTDTITWTSSDNSIATVSNGVVTSAGLGTATITATCGNFSATCAVTVSAIIDGTRLRTCYASGDTSYSGGNGLPYINNSSGSRYAGIVASSGTLSLYGQYAGVTYYPLALPANTAVLKISVGSDIRGNTILLCSNTTPAASQSTVAQLVDKTKWADLAPVDGVITVPIPSYDGFPAINAVVICLQKISDSEFTESDFVTVNVEALAAE